MEYTVQKLGKLAGISTRTLRYYDEIGILKPARINSSEYRIYGTAEVNRLRQILFYLLIANVEKTIDLTEGRIKMSDKEKFEGFKKKMVEENEEKYGEEIRKRYGKDMVEKSNEKVLNMTKEQYDEVTVLE